MPDEKRPPDPNIPPDESSRAGDDLSASTIFVEMMRQAAARRAEMGLTPPDAPPITPAEPRQPPQHVSPKVDRRPVTTPRAPDSPAIPEQKPPTINEIPERLDRLPNSRRARPRRDLPTDTQPAINTSEPTPAPVSQERQASPVSHQKPAAVDQPPPDASASVPPVAPEQPLEESRPRPTVRRMPPALVAVPQPAPDMADEDSDESESDNTDGEAIQEQRIRRVQRRKERQFRRRAGMIGGFVRTAIIVMIAALLASTIFTWFTRPDFFKPDVAENLEVARATGVYMAQPTALPTPNWLRKIGIVSGHRGPQSDPGAVCPDGLKEADINFAVAQIVVKNLRSQGYSVDLLDEFDPRLDNYQAAALVSIHANTCQDWGEVVSGFLVAKAAARAEGGLDTLLSECIADQYGLITGLERRFNLTVDMTDYHTFREIHPFTPASIIELGFLLADREVLTTRQDDMGRAITEGILCFLQPQQPMGGVVTATPGEFIPTPTLATPAP
jgi:N-acetylmuramoyl-L-alanine amidase